MPDSKLVEKLGFEIRNSHKFLEQWPVIRIDKGGARRATEQEIALWNLCLELSERLEKLRKASQDASFFLGTVWNAQELGTSNEKTTHLAWRNLQKAVAEVYEAERLAEKEKKA